MATNKENILKMEDLTSDVEKPTKKPGLKHLWTSFASNTTAHGFSQLIISSNGFMKCFWITAIIGCQVLLYLQIYPLVVRYLQKPTRTRIVLKDETCQQFPMITVCNTNSVRQSMLRDLKETTWFQSRTDLVDKMRRKKRETEDEDETVKPNATVTEGIWSRDETFYREYLTKNDILRGLATLALTDGETVFEYGHQFHKTIIKCNWKNYFDCRDEASWSRVWHWKYGNCYTFNLGTDESNLVSVTGIGPNQGLELRLRLNQDEYLRNSLTDTAAIILHIGEQGSRIDPHENGIGLAPNFAYYIGLQKKKIKRADPFGNNTCIPHSKVDLGPRSFSNRIITKYSIQTCEEICLAEAQIKECGCTSYWLPSLRSNRTCTPDDGICEEDLPYEAMNKLLPCTKKCRFPCDETKYEMETSFRQYPTKKKKANIPDDEELKVNIYFKTLETQSIQDEEFYFIENLLGDIGGQLGLFSGVSALTVVELLFLLGNILVLIGITFKYIVNKHTKIYTK